MEDGINGSCGRAGRDSLCRAGDFGRVVSRYSRMSQVWWGAVTLVQHTQVANTNSDSDRDHSPNIILTPGLIKVCCASFFCNSCDNWDKHMASVQLHVFVSDRAFDFQTSFDF